MDYILLEQYLVVSAGVSDNQNTRFDVATLDLVGEGTRGVSLSNLQAVSVLGKFEDRATTEGGSSNGNNIRGVLNSDDDASSKDKFFPSHTEVDDIDT